MEHTSPLLHDPTLWLVFSFVAFVILAFVFGRRSILQTLDSQIDKIRQDIASAEKLQSDAEVLLNQYKSKLDNAAVDAERIIAKARAQADDIRAQGEADLNDTMLRREAMLKTRIEQMERTAMDDLKRYAAELAVSATSEIIAQKLSSQASNKLADESIRHIGEKLN